MFEQTFAGLINLGFALVPIRVQILLQLFLIEYFDELLLLLDDCIKDLELVSNPVQEDVFKFGLHHY